MEKLDHFVDNLFDGNVVDLPILQEVIDQASKLADQLHEASVELNSLIADKSETNERMKSATSKFVIRELGYSYWVQNNIHDKK